MRRASEDKLTKYRFLKQSNKLVFHLPETHRLTFNSFLHMIDKYNKVIVKPIGKGGGFGVIQISTLADNWYEVHIENKKNTIYGIKQLYDYVKTKSGSLNYLVQQCIPLAQVDHRPFDMRIIVQRKKHSRVWKVTGRAGKVAGEGYIVTNNSRSKGTLLPIETAIQKSSLRNSYKPQIMNKIYLMAKRVAERLSRLYPTHRIFGLDVGLDQEGHVWLIEANKYPSMSHFFKLKDFTTYRRIQAIKKGRVKPLRN